jgi:hypothetical protein
MVSNTAAAFWEIRSSVRHITRGQLQWSETCLFKPVRLTCLFKPVRLTIRIRPHLRLSVGSYLFAIASGQSTETTASRCKSVPSFLKYLHFDAR